MNYRIFKIIIQKILISNKQIDNRSLAEFFKYRKENIMNPTEPGLSQIFSRNLDLMGDYSSKIHKIPTLSMLHDFIQIDQAEISRKKLKIRDCSKT